MKLKLPSSKVFVLGLLAALLLAAIVFVFRRAGPLAPVRVTIVQATEGSLTPALYGIGTVEARRSYLIGPTVAGRVLRVLVDAGDTVKAGQLLAEMDPVDLDNRLVALDASMARGTSAIAAADAQTADAAARRELASVNARRYVELGQQNFMSAGAVEAKVQEQTSAEAGARAAQANLSAARQDLVRLKAERAALAQQRQNVRLLATQDGVVMSRDAEPGSTVVAGQGVLKLVDPASLWVKARFDQGRSAGAAMRATLMAVHDFAVALKQDGPMAEVAYDAQFKAHPVGNLHQFAGFDRIREMEAAWLPATPRALLLPNAAIKRQSGQAGVWLLEDGSLRFAPLRLGQTGLDGQVQVLDGLKAGKQVVVYSEKDVDAHSRIQVVKSLVVQKEAQGKP